MQGSNPPISFMLRNWSYNSSSWLDKLWISDGKFVNHTTEMILWSMILVRWVFLKNEFQSGGRNVIEASKQSMNIIIQSNSDRSHIVK